MKDSYCPCQLFCTPSHVISALRSEEKAEILLKWIQGDSIEYHEEGCQKKKSSQVLICKNHKGGFHRDFPCQKRLESVYTILNAIRDACRVYLEGNNKLAQDTTNIITSQQSQSKSTVLLLSDEDAFPFLVSSNLSQISQKTNILQPKRKNKLNKPIAVADTKINNTGNEMPSKRRIRPAQLGTDHISQSPWAVEVTLSEHLHSASFVDPMNRVMTSKTIAGTSRKSHDLMQKVMSTTNDRKKVGYGENRFDQSRQIQKEPRKEIDAILLDSTVKVYCAIVTSNMVPSLALELQLLIRLLSLNADEANITSSTQDAPPLLHELFVDEHACRNFACRVLSQLQTIILNLEYHIAMSLLKLSAFLDYLPSLAQQLEQRLDHYRQITTHGNDTNFVSGKSFMLSVPFQESRDSRHNFRSQKLAALYNNREKCRDSFLFQLRAFQQMRSTVLNPTQVQQTLKAIKDSSIEVIQNILTANIPWFTEFFVDLLLQIGLVQIQETDDDILKNVRDKEKLQKLHNRFTSKATQKNKSTNRLVLRENDESDGLGPDQFFTGNQEFFFIFVKYVDSYRFISHLKRRLVDLIMMHSKSTETKHLEQRISELQMLSRFLGLIHFSPNYNLPEDALDVTGSPIIPLHDLIKDAFRDGKLLVIIPWIINFMQMIQWDKVSMKSKYYQDVLGLLRSIQKHITRTVLESDGYHINLQLLGFQIDSFFSETIGLYQIEQLENCDLPFQKHQETSLDMIPFVFSKEFIFATSTHIDDLCKLIADITVNGGITNNSGASKKLKPYMLSSQTVSVKNSFLESRYLNVLDHMDQQRFDVEFLHLEGHSTKDNINDKLVDAFFHLHKDLQQVCEFVVDFAVQNVVKNIVREVVTPYAKYILNSFLLHESIPNPVDLEWYLRVHKSAESKTLLQVQLHSKSILKSYIEKSLLALVPSYVDDTVRNTSITLALQHAYRKVENYNIGIVRKEVKSYLNERMNSTNPVSDSLTASKVFDVTLMTSEAKILLKTISGSSGIHNLPNRIILDFVSSLSAATKKLESCLENPEFIGDEMSHLSIEINDLLRLFEQILEICFQRSLNSNGAYLVQAIIEVSCFFLNTPCPAVCFENLDILLTQPYNLLMMLECFEFENVLRKSLSAQLISGPNLENGINQLLDSFNLSQNQAQTCMRLINKTHT